MTCPSHTTNEQYHTAPPKIVQSTAQPAHNTHTAYNKHTTHTQHTLCVVRSQSSENF